jgi:hypothetical protein
MKQKAHTRSSHLPATTWMLRKPQFGPNVGYVNGPPGFYYFFYFFIYFLAGDGFEPVMLGPSS